MATSESELSLRRDYFDRLNRGNTREAAILREEFFTIFKRTPEQSLLQSEAISLSSAVQGQSISFVDPSTLNAGTNILDRSNLSVRADGITLPPPRGESVGSQQGPASGTPVAGEIEMLVNFHERL